MAAGQRGVDHAVGYATACSARSTADATGAVHARVAIPADAPLGFSVLAVNGSTAAGVPQEIVTALSVVGDAPTRRAGSGRGPRCSLLARDRDAC